MIEKEMRQGNNAGVRHLFIRIKCEPDPGGALTLPSPFDPLQLESNGCPGAREIIMARRRLDPGCAKKGQTPSLLFHTQLQRLPFQHLDLISQFGRLLKR
jgi:hypothetical protein